MLEYTRSLRPTLQDCCDPQQTYETVTSNDQTLHCHSASDEVGKEAAGRGETSDDHYIRRPTLARQAAAEGEEGGHAVSHELRAGSNSWHRPTRRKSPHCSLPQPGCVQDGMQTPRQHKCNVIPSLAITLWTPAK